ncbi:MAG: glycosyltransferase family 2 protein [Acidobacteriia bacterium]|nr:glycosyltransferase family 2 protein [Terriglobia bacterium]
MIPISACLITLNEEHNLPRALASLQGIVEEILVVDSGSTDRTVEIARAAGARVLSRAWSGYAEQKNYAAEQATHEWVLSLDADEELSTALQGALLKWKAGEPSAVVYEVSRRTWYLGAWIRHSGWYPDYQRRLFRRDAARFAGLVHESLQPAQANARVGRLAGDLLHYTVRSFAEHEANVEHYTTLAAEQLYRAGRRKWRGAMRVAAPWAWLRSYVLQGGFLDGARGAMIARMAARGVRLKFAKLGRLIEQGGRGASA